MRLILKALAVVAILAAGFWLVIYSYNAILGFGERGDTVVPDLRGKTLVEARNLLKQKGLSVSVERSEFHPKMPKDAIVSQDPDPGMTVKMGRPVLVVVSQGAQTVAVPDLRGLDFREAEIQLQNLKLSVGTIKYIPHPVAKKDVVVDQNPPADAQASAGDKVDLTVSTGPPPSVSMPNLVGNDLDYAKNVLSQHNLQMGQIGWRWDDSSQAGTVLTQNPAPDAKVLQGSMASLVVSAGPKNGDLPFKQSYITISLPQFEGHKEVTVWVTDETTTNEVYEGMHSGGDVIHLMISAFGDSTVDVKLGNEVLSSGKL